MNTARHRDWLGDRRERGRRLWVKGPKGEMTGTAVHILIARDSDVPSFPIEDNALRKDHAGHAGGCKVCGRACVRIECQQGEFAVVGVSGVILRQPLGRHVQTDDVAFIR